MVIIPMLTGLIQAFLSCLITGDTMECAELLNQIVEVNEMVSEEKKPIKHLGYSDDSYVQEFVNYAYELGGIDFVTMIECENGRWTLDGKSDGGHSHGLCMINDRWHKIPDGFYTDYKIQIDYCYQKFIGGTKFYGPSRKIKGVKCKDYVLNRFEINDTKSN